MLTEVTVNELLVHIKDNITMVMVLVCHTTMGFDLDFHLVLAPCLRRKLKRPQESHRMIKGLINEEMFNYIISWLGKRKRKGQR